MPAAAPRTFLIAIAFCLTAASFGWGDWPTFAGDGDRTPPVQNVELVDHLENAVKLWETDRHMGVGKGLYPSSLRYARDHGIQPFYGGTASPIVADGFVFVSYYKPNGNVPAKRTGWRTMDKPEKLALLPDWFFSVTADDILVAIDAKTGRIAWEAVEKDKAHNRLGHKRNHWGVSPAYADGRVFSFGPGGRMYAYAATTGKKLWETVAAPWLKQEFDEYKKKGELKFKDNLKTSLVVAQDRVVLCHGSVSAFHVATGEKAWTLSERGGVASKHTTPVIWRHDGVEYLLINNRAGTVRLIDPRDGSVVWTHAGLGNQFGMINLTGDHAILNAGSKKASDEKSNGLFACFQVSLKGLTKKWSLPDEEKYWHSWTMDRGAERRAAIHQGRVYFVVGLKKADRLVTVDLKTGKILDEHAAPFLQAPYPIEDRILMYDDRAHTDPVTASWWSIEDPDAPELLHRPIGFGPRTITGYEVPIEWPYVDGILYGRTFRGIAAWDLRKPEKSAENRPLRLVIPHDLTGPGDDLHATIIQRDGKPVAGGYRGAPRLGSIDVVELKKSDNRLTGTLGIDTSGRQAFERYHLDATISPDGTLTGTVTSHVPPFKQPIKVADKITRMPHQPAWMPPAKIVLRLHDAAIQQGGSRGRLLLFLSPTGDSLGRVTAWADQTTKTRPVIDESDLTLTDDRLTGTLRVRYRPDQWTDPLTETGHTAAATYHIDARLDQPVDATVGSYTGQFGTEWKIKKQLTPPTTD